MTNEEQKLREFVSKYVNDDNEPTFLSDLTALISEDYVEKKDAGYPLEFVEWLIKDQEIFFGELNEKYILNDNIHVDGRKLQTIDELFNYWKENEQEEEHPTNKEKFDGNYLPDPD